MCNDCKMWSYKQTTATSNNSANGTNIPNSYAKYTLQTTAPITNAVSTIMTKDATPTSNGGISAPLITLPYAGVYTLYYQVRFNASSTENAIWFAPCLSSWYGETNGNNGNSSRLSYTSFSSYNASITYTGYFNANDTIACCAYSNATTSLVTGFSNAIAVTLQMQTAP